jgi:putative peptidoglycan lipid II flippase
VSGIFASFLPKGSISLLYLGQRFMNLPLGMFAVALSSILLPHFSRVVLYAPKRLNFYILEATKFVSWVIIPIVLFLMFCSENIFITFLGSQATPENIFQAKWILIFYLSGLLFLCLNRVLLNVFYAMKDTTATSIAAGASAVINIIGDIVGIYFFGAYGIAIANTIAGLSLTLLCFYFLHTRHQFYFYSGNYFNFLGRYIAQLSFAACCFMMIYAATMHHFLALPLYQFISTGLGYWLLVPPLGLACMIAVFLTRRAFVVDLYFLNK